MHSQRLGAAPRILAATPLRKLSVADVATFLTHYSLSVFVDAFAAEEINGEQLAIMEDADLLDLGDFAPLKRRRLLELVAKSLDGISSAVLVEMSRLGRGRPRSASDGHRPLPLEADAKVRSARSTSDCARVRPAAATVEPRAAPPAPPGRQDAAEASPPKPKQARLAPRSQIAAGAAVGGAT